jgi:hypothetical protein
MPKKRPSVPAPRTSAWFFLMLVCITLLTVRTRVAWRRALGRRRPSHACDLRSLHGLARIWTEIGATQQYYPLVHSLFWLMFQLWGAQTLGYHLVNILLHATSAFLIARLLRRLDIPGAIPAADRLRVHPVQVESVAWMTELKNTLSGVLAIAALLTYVRYDATRARRHMCFRCCCLRWPCWPRAWSRPCRRHRHHSLVGNAAASTPAVICARSRRSSRWCRRRHDDRLVRARRDRRAGC